ncbi:MAG: hypothetical protein KC643_29300 [Nitrospira sp.]|nr:hypothetical protein [Nitrospira sp.]
MSQMGKGILFAGLILVILGGCRTAPIYNVNEASIPNAIGKELPLEEVTKGIVAAGAKHGWAMNVEKPGKIVGTLGVRGHVAIVDIIYNTKSYSITYKDSNNLKYDKEDSTIHSNYNAWIRNLHVSIQRNFGGSGQPN